jgi:S-adenosylmethionine:diacylglycerol 3-amino-3-carboxypropyl transferase
MATQAKRIIEEAVVRKDAKVSDKLLDKAFALAFKGLVYAQIWEDPVVDMEGLDIQPDSRPGTGPRWDSRLPGDRDTHAAPSAAGAPG